MLNILYEDNHIIVVEKPVGILSQADKSNAPDMLSLIKAYIKEKYHKPGNVYLGLVHRLDRNVGGIMVFAKTSKAASRLSEQVRLRTLHKNYLAVVHGLTPPNGRLIHYLSKDEERNFVSVVSEAEGKYAELSYKRLADDGQYSLVQVDLKTGRPHQIRVQFAAIGHPLYGDHRYGKKDDAVHIALFANQLAFIHPTTKAELQFELRPTKPPFTKFNF